MLFGSIIAASTLAVFAGAQSITTTVSQAMPAVATQGFNIGLVTATRKSQWCRAQFNTCNDICGRTLTNDCDAETLVYSCACYNGTEPDSTSFLQTIPWFECEETLAQCLNNTPSTNPDGQEQCRSNAQCPTRNATAEEATASTTSSGSSSASATGSQTNTASASGASSTSSQAAAPSVTPASTGAFVALLFAICKLVL